MEYTEHNCCNFYQKEFNVECDHGAKEKEFNLVSYFTDIELEKRDENLTPDVRLFNAKTNESIYIEIAVTHKSDSNKIASGNRIIEFIIKEEDDITIFEDRRIPLEDERIIRYNFKDEIIKKDNCGGKCTVDHNVFIVFISGKSIVTQKNLTDLHWLNKGNKILGYEIVKTDPNERYRPFRFTEKVIEFHEKGIGIKNCFLCHFHDFRKDHSESNKQSIFCKHLEFYCNSNKAANCDHYTPDKKTYRDHLFPK